MFDNFELTIDNFGPIEHADLDLSNKHHYMMQCRWKTSMSKLLYCIITAFSRNEDILPTTSLKDKLNQLIIDDNKDFIQ